jgi:type IV pilus assembly protein PilQ
MALIAVPNARAVTPPLAPALEVRSISVVPGAAGPEVVIAVDDGVEVEEFTLANPHRIVVDFKGALLTIPANFYDKVNRGGITNIRAAQYAPGTVRIVIELDAVRTHQITRRANELRVSIAGTTVAFDPWYSMGAKDRAVAAADLPAQRPAAATTSVAALQSTQPRITVAYQDADIRDVIAAFASFSGRTIVIGKDVSGTVTAEIRNQPWDVALRAILQGQGLAASEDPGSGIIAVDSYKNIATKVSSEPLTTQLIPINYANAGALANTIKGLLSRDCTPGGVPEAPAQNAQTSCFVRGSVSADTATNTLVITEAPSRLGDLMGFIRSLDVRTPQVAIKAKIIFVNRTDIEELGLTYDLGTGTDQFFSRLVQRTDPTTTRPVDTNGDGVPDALGGGTPFQGDRILLGGNALSAIANANARVTNPALSLVFSTALGRFQLTSFLDALQEVRLADLQAEPSIVTLDNRRAEILVGQEIPIRVLDASAGAGVAGGTGQVPRATVQLKEVGIILSVTPHITNNRQVLLTVHAENSDAQLASSDVGFIFGKQRADNQLLVADGETAVIGGLTVTQVTQSKSGIPLLVDLPLIGRLFGITRTSQEKRDLLILITPHIVDEGERARTRQ